jgi:hypothetical protein
MLINTHVFETDLLPSLSLATVGGSYLLYVIYIFFPPSYDEIFYSFAKWKTSWVPYIAQGMVITVSTPSEAPPSSILPMAFNDTDEVWASGQRIAKWLPIWHGKIARSNNS